MYDGASGRMMANVNRTPGYWVPVPLVDTPGMFGLRSLTTAQPIVSAPVPPAFAPGLIVADEPSAATDLTTVPSLTNEPCRFRPTSLATNVPAGAVSVDENTPALVTEARLRPAV